MNLFNFSLKFNGYPIKKAKDYLKTIQDKNEEEHALYIDAKKQEIVSFHLKHNSFYQTLAKGANPKNWNSIPIMTKRDLQQPLQTRLSDGYSLKNIHVNKTSGSSGTPFVFAKDKFCHALTWAGFIDKYSWFGIDLNTSKQARFYGISSKRNKIEYYRERIKDFLSNRYRFPVFDLSDSQFQKNILKFKSTKFQYINGYTSAIVQFAKFLERENIILKNECPSLISCIVTAEILFEKDRILLEKQLGVPIINEYGSAELGLIALNNTKNQWAINNDDLFIEILDKNNQALPHGKDGRIVITSLYNKAHPFIRYDIGDIGSLSKDSTLRVPTLESLIGRSDDIVLLPSGKKATGLTFYYVTKTVVDSIGSIKEFVIEQLELDSFKICYVSSNPLSQKDKAKIKEEIYYYLEPNLKVFFEKKKYLDRSNRGKLKQFKSYL